MKTSFRVIACAFCLLAACPGRLQAAEPEPSRSTAGVGLALEIKGGQLFVTRVLPDSPAFAERSIGPGDRILAIAQDSAPAVETKELSLTKAVGLIRGTEGSTVWLTVVPAGKDESQARSISFVRGTLQQVARWGDGVRLPEGTKAPDLRMVELGDISAGRLADHAGKIAVLEFWSVGCKPCQKLMAELQTYRTKYPVWKEKVVLIGVSVDDDRDAAARHVKAQGWDQTHNVWVDSDGLKAFHVNGLPTIYVLGPDGKVAGAEEGEDTAAVVNRLIEAKTDDHPVE